METLSLYGKMIESPLVCITIHVTYVTYSLMVFIRARDSFEKKNITQVFQTSADRLSFIILLSDFLQTEIDIVL